MLFGAALGSMEVMIPGTFVCLMTALLPILGPLELRTEMLLGAGFGYGVFLLFAIWDEKLRGQELRPGTPKGPPPFSSRPGGWPMPAWLYDLLEGAGSRRRAQAQKALYQEMTGRVLFAAAGTGLNFPNFPPGKDIVAIDVSSQMLERARARARKYAGKIALREADVQRLPFADESFDTVATASTFCSVPDPIQGFRELHRVLRPGGKLLMFEHVRSRNRLLAGELDALNLILHRIGPEVNRDTVANARRAGFLIDRITCTYLDIFLAVAAQKPAPSRLPQPLPSASRRKETRYDQEFEPQRESDDQR
jgi:SAM-dependent methyltransferase